MGMFINGCMKAAFWRGGVWFVLFLFAVGVIAKLSVAASPSNDVHLNLFTYDNVSNTTEEDSWNFTFNWTTGADCSGVVNSTNQSLSSNHLGIISVYLQGIELDFLSQYWLCIERNGSLWQKPQVAKVPYAFYADYAASGGSVTDEDGLYKNTTNMNVSILNVSVVSQYNRTVSNDTQSGTPPVYSRVTSNINHSVTTAGFVSPTGHTGMSETYFFENNGASTFTAPTIRRSFVRYNVSETSGSILSGTGRINDQQLYIGPGVVLSSGNIYSIIDQGGNAYTQGAHQFLLQSVGSGNQIALRSVSHVTSGSGRAIGYQGYADQDGSGEAWGVYGFTAPNSKTSVSVGVVGNADGLSSGPGKDSEFAFYNGRGDLLMQDASVWITDTAMSSLKTNTSRKIDHLDTNNSISGQLYVERNVEIDGHMWIDGNLTLPNSAGRPPINPDGTIWLDTNGSLMIMVGGNEKTITIS